MDISLVNASIFNLPTSSRAAALVYDIASDLQLWRPPGPDRELWDEYGEDLQDVLDKEATRLPSRELAEGEVLRLHPGKLHCDFLILLASRPPHGEEQPATGPDIEGIAAMVKTALNYAAKREVTRVAIPALGGGRGSLDVGQRLSAVLRGVQAYKDDCFREGRPAGIEEVVICDKSSAALATARRSAASTAKTRMVEAKPPASSKEAAPRKSRASGSKKSAAPRLPRGLSADGVATAHASAPAYDRTMHYLEGQWFVHPKFGAGCVQEVQADQRIIVLFEDGSRRTMLHSRNE